LSRPEPIRLRLPIPFPIGHVNAYLLLGEPLTLVDPGPCAEATLAALEAALAEHRVSVEDVELLVLTHQHVDHAGLAAEVRRRSGCEVAAHELTAEVVRDVGATRAADDAYAEALLALHGAPSEVVATVAEAFAHAPAFDVSVDVTVACRDGDILLAGGTELAVLARPGHSPTDTIFAHEDEWALVADHLLARGPSVVMAHRPPAGSDDPRRRPRAMLGYRDSLARTAALGLRRAFPGHGAAVDDLGRAVEHQLMAQERNAERLLDYLRDGPRTAWQVVELSRGRTVLRGDGHPWSEAYIVLSDVLAHLDVLVADGRARETVERNAPRYEAC
jgi:glyoxylase-like metal-dependent hydrolase (beta-lactamase superfamily II)